MSVNTVVFRAGIAIGSTDGLIFAHAIVAEIGCAEVAVVTIFRHIDALSVDAEIIGAGIAIIQRAQKHIYTNAIIARIGSAGVAVITI